MELPRTARRLAAVHVPAYRPPPLAMTFPSPRPTKQILADDAALRQWDERRRRLEALSGIVRGFLPRPLAERVRVTAAEDRELTLAADAGASAAIIRQRTPDLLAALQREGWNITEIRVRVQVRSEPAPAKKALPNQVDSAHLRPLTRLARELPDGPLKTALGRFLRRAG